MIYACSFGNTLRFLGFERREALVHRVDLDLVAPQLAHELVDMRPHFTRRAVRPHRHTDDDSRRLPFIDNLRDRVEVRSFVGVGDDAQRAGRRRNGLADGNADAPQAEIKRENRFGSGVSVVRRGRHQERSG